MENKTGMAYHNVLYFLKWAVMLFAIADLVTLFFHPYSYGRTADQIFAAVKIILLAVSVIRHNSRAGFCFLLAYFAVELGYFLFIYDNIGANADVFYNQVWDYSLGTIIILVPTVIYYKKRWSLLK